MNNQERLCLVDSDESSLQEIASLIRKAGYSVTTCRSGRELFEHLKQQQIFCIVFDANTPDLNGIALQKLLASQSIFLPVIFIAAFSTISTTVQAMKAGAVDFLAKPVDPPHLLAAIQEAARNYLKTRQVNETLTHFNSLTHREQEVFELVTAGMLNKQIAAQLGVSEKTVKVHRGRLMRKLEVRSIAELVRMSEKIFPKDKVQPATAESVLHA